MVHSTREIDGEVVPAEGHVFDTGHAPDGDRRLVRDPEVTPLLERLRETADPHAGRAAMEAPLHGKIVARAPSVTHS